MAALERESDRGCALMAAAYLDAMLERLLRRAFVDNQSVANGLLDQTKPLGTFSSRIDLAYLLGHIGEHARRDLHLIRKIRNEFAHTTDLIDFVAPAIVGRCGELHCPLRKTGDSPRKHYINAVLGLYGIIEHAVQEQAHPEQKNDLEPTETFRNFWAAIAKKLAARNPEPNEPEI